MSKRVSGTGSELKRGQESPTKLPSENRGELERTKLYIKTMESIRCKMVVKEVLENLGLNYATVEPGEVEILGHLSYAKQEQIKSDLSMHGLEVVEDERMILVEKVRNVIVDLFHDSDGYLKMDFTEYLSKKLNRDYTYLSVLFLEIKGMTIKHFIRSHKIERVKELLVYEDLSLAEIARKLHYSHVSDMANQFKKATGLTPSHFKNMKGKRCMFPVP